MSPNPSPARRALSPNLRASLCMMLAMAGFSINDALVKTSRL